MSYVGLYDDEGSRNAFYMVTKKIGRKRIGFKEFGNKQEAVFAHRVQKHLAQYNLAPMVYGDVGYIRKYSDDSGEFTSYGYLTEVARQMPDCRSEHCDGECFDTSCKNSYIINNVVDAMAFHGLSYTDHHRGNFGYVRREGKWIPVVIDVGAESFEDWNTDIYGYFEYDDPYNPCDCTACEVIRNQRNV